VTRRIQIERAAELDIAEITAEIRDHRPASALRFVKATRGAFQSLAAHPQLGRRYETTHPLLQNLRIWRVTLVFAHNFTRWRLICCLCILGPDSQLWLSKRLCFALLRRLGRVENKLHLAQPHDPPIFEQVLHNAPVVDIGTALAL